MIITITMNPAVDKTAYLDTFVIGELNRLSTVFYSVGGKGINVSRTIKTLNGNSLAMGFIAGSNGDYILKELHEAEIENILIEVEGNTRSNLKIIDQNKVLTELNEEGPTIDTNAMAILREKLLSLVTTNDIIILSGSVPNGVKKTIYHELIIELKTKGCSVIVDADDALLANAVEAIPHVIKGNQYEICKYYDVNETSSQQELITLGQKLLKKGIELVVISMGEQGAIFLDQNHIGIAEGLKVKVLSTVGAGDAMLGAIAYAREQKMSFVDMCKLAIATSTGACMSEGTQPASIQVIQALLAQVEINIKKTISH